MEMTLDSLRQERLKILNQKRLKDIIIHNNNQLRINLLLQQNKKAKLKFEEAAARAKAEEDARLALIAEAARAKAEEDTRLALIAEAARAKAEEDARLALIAEAKAEEDSRLALIAEAARAKAEEELRLDLIEEEEIKLGNMNGKLTRQKAHLLHQNLSRYFSK